MRCVGAVGVAAAVVGAGTIAVVAGQDQPRLLPSLTSAGAAESYRVVYEVRADGARHEEERVVVRPFDSHVVVRDIAGAVISERASRAGLLATRSGDAELALLEVPFAPATGDTRLDLLGDDAEATELVGPGSESGRACTVLRTVHPGQAVAEVERCVDEAGIVLRETWRGAGGETLQTAVAVSVETDGIELGPRPEGTPVEVGDGGGAVRRMRDAEPIPFAETFSLDPGAGWEHVGRFQVVPPALEAAPGGLSAPDTAMVSDVWQRGPALLVLDQGASKTGAPPFDPEAGRAVRAGAPGRGRLVVDDRLASVQVVLSDGGFLRLSATVPADELIRIARLLIAEGGAT